MESVMTVNCPTKKESQSGSTIPVVDKDVLLGVLFGGKSLSREDRKIIRGWLVVTAKVVDKRLFHTNKLSDRELVIRYLKDEDLKEAFYIQAACSPQPRLFMGLMIFFLLLVFLAIEWPRLSAMIQAQ